jgi:thiosulfate/3-mercaptopyruvate sulfurtransferase
MQVWKTLIPPHALAEQIGNPDWLIVDTRFDLAAPAAGPAAYAAAHIPGAHYAHLDEDLAGPIRPDTGRHPLPDPSVLAAKLGAWGLGEAGQLVAYDDGSGALAARLWWLARWLGHDAVAVLDGGLAAWRALGLPLDAERPLSRPREFLPHVRPELAIGVDDVAAGLAQREILLLDARSAVRFRGESEPIDVRAGHVPGAVNQPFQENLGADGRFLDPQELAARYAAVLAECPPPKVVSMCGSGVTACHNLLALEHAGLHGARLYVGSWSEWIRDVKRPIAIGPD